MKYKLILNIIDFKDIEDDWQALYDKDKENTVFQSFEFNYFSWIYNLSQANNILAIVIAYDSDKIKAIFPFYIDKRSRLRFINDLHADFCNAISIVDINFNDVIKVLRHSFKFRYFKLVNLKKESSLLDYSNIRRCNVISRLLDIINIGVIWIGGL